MNAENKLCKALLKSCLIENEAGFYTENEAFYFTPTDDPVMTRPRIGRPGVPSGKIKWSMEYSKLVPGSRWEPDDYELVEHCRTDTLWEAIQEAAKLAYSWQVDNTAQAIGCESEAAFELEGKL